MTDPTTAAREQEQTLHDLESRLERATRAAERLLAQAGADEAGDGSPDGGWRRRDEDRWTRPPLVDAADLQRLLAVLATVLERVPADLQQRVAAALRELLLALRALIDWCLERAERRRDEEPPEVQDIPIL